MASKLDQSARVCAIVVTYHPHAAFLENVKNLAAEVASVIVADNTEGVETPECLRAVQNARGVEILRNGENRGIAVALNLGIKQAIGLGFQWVATFDQDSAITSNYFESMFAAYESCPFRDHVPLIAPELCYSEPESQQKRGSDAHFLFSETTTAMTSGSLIRTDIFATAGFYDETFFMDYVDYEFCLRLEKHGWKVIRARQAHLLHRLGLPQTHSFLGFKVSIKSHNAWRRYYIMRNRIIVFRRYALSSPRWCLYDFFWIFLELAKIVLFEQEKGRQLRATARGLWHGFIGNTSASA